MPSGRYMDIVDGNVVVKRRNGFDSQKWFFDQKTRTVKSVAHKEKSWHMHPNGNNRDLIVYKTTGKWFQTFRYQGANFVNARGLVLTIKDNKDFEGAAVVAWKKHNGLNQRWNVVYSDKATGPKTGGLDGHFGLHINRPFVVLSKA